MNVEKTGRTIFIGDVHGCLEEFQTLVKQMDLQPQDRVILTGDLINKGPYSAEVVDYCYQSGFESVVGNHDWKYRVGFETEKQYRIIRQKLSDPCHQWFMNLPLTIEGDDFVVVHGGLLDDRHLENLGAEFAMTVREWNGAPWHHWYRGERQVVYGHWARQGYLKTEKTLCLDGGCVYGGHLLGYIWQTSELFKVRAKRVYEEICYE